MQHIDVLVQGDGLADIAVVSVAPTDTLDAVLGKLERAVPKGEALLFLEDVPGPIDTDTLVEELLPLSTDDNEKAGPLRLHVARCRRVEITVRFNGEAERRRFPPSATVERVRRWAARRAFDLSPRDAAEHVLQLQGSMTRPDRDVHIGSLTDACACAVAFDLVPFRRVEG